MTLEHSLYDAVFAAPDDDGPREALAAFLAARGDLRGELITLQLAAARAGKASRVEAARVKALLAEHEDEWLEPLRGTIVKRTIRWERGFPVAGRLALQKTIAAQEALIGLRSLATLRALTLEPPNSVLPIAWLERFLFETPLRRLRALHDMRRGLLPRMLREREPFAIEVLDVATEGGGGVEGERHERALADTLEEAFAVATGLPRLRELTFSLNHAFGRDPATYAWLWSSQVGRKLETLRMVLGVHSLAAWHDALTRHASRISLQRLVFFGRNELVLERTDAGFSRLVVRLSPELYPKERENVEAALRDLGGRVSVEHELPRKRS